MGPTDRAGASALRQSTVFFDDPTWALTPGLTRFQTLNSSVTFPDIITTSITTLSTTVTIAGQDVTGLIYTPDLDSTSSCFNASQPYVPYNVTRQGSLPNQNFDLIGVAPFLSPECVFAYLEAAHHDPINGFVFFTTDVNGTGTLAGPDDPQWDLGDGGGWKSTYKFPVYVVDGAVGTLLLRRSGLYSGNLTGVPWGHTLATAYSPQTYVRLYMTIYLNSPRTTPPLWVYLIIVIGILLAVIATTMVSMHWLQRRKRRSLRRRIIAGEVDLEALGIQRLIVPQELLDRMPVFEFGTGKPFGSSEKRPLASLARQDGINEKIAASVTTESTHISAQDGVSTTTTTTHPARFRNHMNQPTCPICLDDFAMPTDGSTGSAVRQLPCHHIFHPECVDGFLRENSSLCPVCKGSTLPVGYCPKVITNAMVRRERNVQRMRARITQGERSPQAQSGQLARVATRWRSQRDVRQSASDDDPRAIPIATATPSAPPLHSPRRQEWARQRAMAMLGRRPAAHRAEAQAPSRWQKLFGGVVPGIE